MSHRKVIRETRQTIFESGKARVMMVEIQEGVLVTWPKGTRRRYPVNLVAQWERAVRAEVALLKPKKLRKGGKKLW